MSDKKYPYIGKLKNGSGGVTIFCCENTGAKFNAKRIWWLRDKIHRYVDDWDEEKFKNITYEYLANTYGEVKDERHADFITALAEANGIEKDGHGYKILRRAFSIDDDGLYFWESEGSAKKIRQKLNHNTRAAGGLDC